MSKPEIKPKTAERTLPNTPFSCKVLSLTGFLSGSDPKEFSTFLGLRKKLPINRTINNAKNVGITKKIFNKPIIPPSPSTSKDFKVKTPLTRYATIRSSPIPSLDRHTIYRRTTNAKTCQKLLTIQTNGATLGFDNNNLVAKGNTIINPAITNFHREFM